MNMQRFYIPGSRTILKSDNKFKWRSNGDESVADGTVFEYYYNENFDKKTWEFYGWLGSTDDGTYIGLVFSVPYISDEPFSKVYTLSDELVASYIYSRRLPNGTEFIVVRPEGAQLDIRNLDPLAGTVDASFKALYHNSGKLLEVQGNFHLHRDDL